MWQEHHQPKKASQKERSGKKAENKGSAEVETKSVKDLKTKSVKDQVAEVETKSVKDTKVEADVDDIRGAFGLGPKQVSCVESISSDDGPDDDEDDDDDECDFQSSWACSFKINRKTQFARPPSPTLALPIDNQQKNTI